MRRIPGVLLCLLLPFVSLLAGCGSGSYYATAQPKGGLMLDSAAPAAAPLQEESESAYARAGLPNLATFRSARDEGVSPSPTDRKLIYQGRVAVEVPQPEEAIAGFLAQVTAWGGYMQSQVGNTLTVRFPAEHFEAAFEGLKSSGRVLSEMRQARDVTEEFIDLEIRLDNARKSRDRLLAILERAEKVEDILKIEEQLRRLTDEIETMEGRRKYLADQVAFATLVAEFRAVSEPPPDKRRRRPSRFAWINLVGAERVMEDF